MTHIQAADGGAEALPADFPGHQGMTVRAGGTGLGGLKSGATTFTGNGTSTDIIVASARAYLAAINRMVASQKPREA